MSTQASCPPELIYLQRLNMTASDNIFKGQLVDILHCFKPDPSRQGLDDLASQLFVSVEDHGRLQRGDLRWLIAGFILSAIAAFDARDPTGSIGQSFNPYLDACGQAVDVDPRLDRVIAWGPQRKLHEINGITI